MACEVKVQWVTPDVAVANITANITSRRSSVNVRIGKRTTPYRRPGDFRTVVARSCAVTIYVAVEDENSLVNAAARCYVPAFMSKVSILRWKLVRLKVRRRLALAIAFTEFARERAEVRYYRRAYRVEDELWRLRRQREAVHSGHEQGMSAQRVG